jgi:hypothetical protein
MSHNIVGSEAISDPTRRLVHFCHAHGSIRSFPRRRAGSAVLAFLAGAAAALAAIAFILTRP